MDSVRNSRDVKRGGTVATPFFGTFILSFKQSRTSASGNLPVPAAERPCVTAAVCVLGGH